MARETIFKGPSTRKIESPWSEILQHNKYSPALLIGQIIQYTQEMSRLISEGRGTPLSLQIWYL